LAQYSGNAITFDPRSPASATSTLVDPDSSEGPEDVSCPSLRQCTLVDGNGRAFTFDPLFPGQPTSLNIHLAGPMALACPTTTQCTAVAGRSEVTFKPRASP
jgi:hypothetical protein